MLKPNLTLNDVGRIKYLHQEHWRRGLRPDYGQTEIWFKALIDWLEARGYDLVPKEIPELETKLVRRGLAKNYLASLVKAVGHDQLVEKTDSTCLTALSLATGEVRLEALKQIISTLISSELNLPRYLTTGQPKPKS